MKAKITKRQKELLNIIYDYIKDFGYPPTFEEMKEQLKVVSNQSIIDLLKKLKSHGLIKRGEAIARSISILPLGFAAIGKPRLVPFVGTTSAGSPTEAIDIAGEWQTLPSSTDKLEKLNSQVFLLKVYGDSMLNAGIEDGDVVLIKSEKEFFSGDIVLAEINGESTIKRFISEDKPPFIYLKPENLKYDLIPASEDMHLTGKVISVLKNGSWKPVK